MTINSNTKTYFSPRNEFSEAHYDLPNNYGMFDIDIMQGEWLNINIEATKNEATYVEYRCLKHDKNENKFNDDRFKPVAFFEYKHHGTQRVKDLLMLPEGKSTWAAFMLAKMVKARFFIVVATNGCSPLYFFEYDGDGKMIPYKTLSYTPEERQKKINAFWADELQLF